MTDDDALDRGLALERTVLAWNRTGLAALALAGVALRVTVEQSGAPLVLGLVLACGLLAESLMAYGYGRRIYLGRAAGPPRGVTIGMASAGTVAALASIGLGLLP